MPVIKPPFDKDAFTKEKTFVGSEFCDCDLSGMDFSGKELSACTFTHCNLSLVKFINASLSENVFRGSKLVGIDFTAIKKPILFRPFLRFEDCLLELCNFSGLNMKEATFESCSLLKCAFDQTDLTQAKFDSTDLEGTDFHHANLLQADFSRSRNYAINPTSNNIKKAKFSIPEALSLLRGFDIEIQ